MQAAFLNLQPLFAKLITSRINELSPKSCGSWRDPDAWRKKNTEKFGGGGGGELNLHFTQRVNKIPAPGMETTRVPPVLCPISSVEP